MTQPEPRSERDAANVALRRIRHIQNDDPEAPALGQKIDCFQSVFGIALAVHPEDAAEIDAGFRGGVRIECAGRIDPGATLALLRGLRYEGE